MPTVVQKVFIRSEIYDNFVRARIGADCTKIVHICAKINSDSD